MKNGLRCPFLVVRAQSAGPLCFNICEIFHALENVVIYQTPGLFES